MFKTIKCVYELLLSQCVLDSIVVNMTLEGSSLRIQFYRYRLLVKHINILPSEIVLLREEFCNLPGSMLDKLKALHSEVFSEVNWGRLLMFLSFTEQVGLTEEEWERLFDFLIPILIQIEENNYISEPRYRNSH